MATPMALCSWQKQPIFPLLGFLVTTGSPFSTCLLFDDLEDIHYRSSRNLLIVPLATTEYLYFDHAWFFVEYYQVQEQWR